MKKLAPLILVAIMLPVCLLNQTAYAGQRKATKKAVTPKKNAEKDLDLYPFVTPIEVRVGYHRMKDPAVFLTLRNDGSNLTIKSVRALVLTSDSIKMKITHAYSLNFEFAIPIPPKGTGESVVTNKDSSEIGNEIDFARCADFEAAKDEPALFIPNKGIKGGDLITIRITSIKYTDGEWWTEPSKTKTQ
jgi:hypothetical protein